MGGRRSGGAIVSLQKVRTAHARARRNFYSDSTAKKCLVPRVGNKRRQLATSLENAHGNAQPAAGKFLHEPAA